MMTIGDHLRRLSRETQTLQWRARYRATCYTDLENVRWINGEPHQRKTVCVNRFQYSWLISTRTGEAVS
jgi:hypothetical protein